MSKKSFPALAIVVFTVLALTAYSLRIPTAYAQTSNPPWQLTITGLVENPLNLTLDEIKAMPSSSEYAVLYCVDNPFTPLSQGTWTGVKLSYLLQLANVSSDATKVAFFAPDGFTTDQPVGAAMQDNLILAYQKDNVYLAGKLVLVAPFEWGYKWISNPTQIQLVNFNFLGTEESQGYPDDGKGLTEQAPIRPPPPPNSPPTLSQQTTPEATLLPTQSPPPTSVTASPNPIPTPNLTITQTQSPIPNLTTSIFPSSSPTGQPTPEPSQTASPADPVHSPTPLSFSLIITVAASTVAAAIFGLMIYFKRIKK